MTDDLKPKAAPVMSMIAAAIVVATAVWAGTTFLQTRADKGAVEKLAADSFLHRLELETMKGEMKTLNIRAERTEKGIDAINAKLDRKERRER